MWFSFIQQKHCAVTVWLPGNIAQEVQPSLHHHPYNKQLSLHYTTLSSSLPRLPFTAGMHNADPGTVLANSVSIIRFSFFHPLNNQPVLLIRETNPTKSPLVILSPSLIHLIANLNPYSLLVAHLATHARTHAHTQRLLPHIRPSNFIKTWIFPSMVSPKNLFASKKCADSVHASQDKAWLTTAEYEGRLLSVLTLS